jgi:hypothetical protein
MHDVYNGRDDTIHPGSAFHLYGLLEIDNCDTVRQSFFSLVHGNWIEPNEWLWDNSDLLSRPKQ